MRVDNANIIGFISFRVYFGSYIEGIKIRSRDGTPIVDWTWDNYPNGEWTEEQVVPDDYFVAGIKTVQSDDDFIRHISVILQKKEHFNKVVTPAWSH